MSACRGTPAYRAPELFRGKQPTTTADVYSLAITLWALKHQQLPYDGQLPYDPEFETLWHPDPERRPEAEQLSL